MHTDTIQSLEAQKQELIAKHRPIWQAHEARLIALFEGAATHFTIPEDYKVQATTRSLTLTKEFGEEIAITYREEYSFKQEETKHTIEITWSNRPTLALLELAGQMAAWVKNEQDKFLVTLVAEIDDHKPHNKEANRAQEVIRRKIADIEQAAKQERIDTFLDEAKSEAGVTHFVDTENTMRRASMFELPASRGCDMFHTIKIVKETPKQFVIHGSYTDNDYTNEIRISKEKFMPLVSSYTAKLAQRTA